jgi:hypothetical protein
MPTRLLIAICLISALLASCSEPKDLEFREFKNLKVENLNFSDAVLKVDLVYFNPNNFGLQLSSTDLDLFVDSNFLGHSAQNIQVAIPRKGVFTLPLQINLDIKNLLKNGLNSLFSKEIAVRLLGKVKVGKGGVYKNFNVDYTSMQNFSLFK